MSALAAWWQWQSDTLNLQQIQNTISSIFATGQRAVMLSEFLYLLPWHFTHVISVWLDGVMVRVFGLAIERSWFNSLPFHHQIQTLESGQAVSYKKLGWLTVRETWLIFTIDWSQDSARRCRFLLCLWQLCTSTQVYNLCRHIVRRILWNNDNKTIIIIKTTSMILRAITSFYRPKSSSYPMVPEP